MIGLVVVTHGSLGSDLIRAMEHIVGRQEGVATIAIGPNDDMERRRKDIRQAIKGCDTGSGVIVVADLFGGTPSNLAISLLKRDRIEVVAGVNLPMLIAFCRDRKRLDVAECAAEITRAGKRYINNARDVLGRPLGVAVEDLTDESDDDVLSLPESIEERQERDDAARLLDVGGAQLTELRLSPEFHAIELSHGAIGHNRPPRTLAARDLAALDEAMIAASVAASEITSAAPRRSVIKLCVASLKRVVRVLRRILKYLGHKGDKFLDAAATSAGKTTGPAIATSLLIAQAQGHLSEAITALMKLAHL